MSTAASRCAARPGPLRSGPVRPVLHRSRSSASVATISVGRGNRHGHPAVEIVDALEAAGMDVRRTDRDGTVRIGLAGIAAG